MLWANPFYNTWLCSLDAHSTLCCHMLLTPCWTSGRNQEWQESLAHHRVYGVATASSGRSQEWQESQAHHRVLGVTTAYTPACLLTACDWCGSLMCFLDPVLLEAFYWPSPVQQRPSLRCPFNRLHHPSLIITGIRLFSILLSLSTYLSSYKVERTENDLLKDSRFI